MTGLLVLHLVAALGAPVLVRWWGRQAFLVLALVPTAAFGWVLGQLGTVTGGGEVRQTTSWVPALGLDVALRLDALALTLAALVSGIGALVLVYCARYFSAGEEGTGRFAAVLTAFAGSMLCLVLADDVFLLYVAWELTTVFSFLLIGGAGNRLAGRRAASQALVLTAAGGLAMLVGLVLLTQASGTHLLSELVARPGDGTVVVVGTLLVLVGAITKSAMVPFHFWLPAAMEAPTPVSAYLHAAAMVKAGIYLVARLAPGLADVPGWRPVVLGLGLATMLVGGYRALRQCDLKLLLAFGTVSQLGFLMVLVGSGSRELAAAGLVMTVAHALFKSTLFLTVGVIDHATGVRDLRKLSGLGRRLPALATVGTLAAASMAGLPPLLGFVGKEAAFAALWDGGLPDRTAAVVVLAGLVAGSALTAAYSARFVWGAFARKPGLPATAPEVAHPPGALFLAAPAVLAVLSLVAGPASPLLEHLVAGYADNLPLMAPEAEHLGLWHGLQPALVLSALSLLGGAALFAVRDRLFALQQRLALRTSADESYWNVLQGLDRLAVLTTGTTQRGSLPAYLGTILVAVLALPGSVLVFRAPWPNGWRAWDTPVQALVGAVVLIAAVLAIRIRQRLSAVLVVGVTGYGLGVLFALQGAPDLALTQFLVETLTLVTFVLVLRKLPKDITERHRPRERVVRGVLAGAMGLLMGAVGAVALSVRTATPVSADYPKEAYEFGGGKNIVNVTLVDIRAWDTFGEISLLVVAATGVASLVFLRRRTGAVERAAADAAGTPAAPAARAPRRRWLSASSTLAPQRRSVVLEVVTRVLFHTIVVFSVYLLFSGHNEPGGGFAGGLVAGLALVLRYLAGGRYELGEAAPVDPGLLLGVGLLFAGGTGVVGLALGAEVLQTAILQTTLPVLGHVKLVTSLFFDVGVYLIVVGLVLDVLRSLGAELDRADDEGDPIDLIPGEVVVR
ncbi:MAG: mnhA [Modestobacter sp.]|nr:mnhA [Modestobacter sp.]